MTTELEYKKPEKEVLGTVDNVRYYHLAYPWDAPLSFGVQALIEYNGVIINDRYQSDLVRITSITGLDDAEIRDSREPKAGKSGEWAYDSFYGGRNLVLNGFIEAGSLQVLKYLEKNLKAAFAPLEEMPLKFRWFDIYDPFDDPNTILTYNVNASLSIAPSGNYIPLIGSLNNLKVENGFLTWKASAENYVLRASEKRTYCDSQQTIKVIVGNYNISTIGLIPAAKNSENYVRLMYNQNDTEPYISIEVIYENNQHILLPKNIPISARPKNGQQIWIRGKKEGNTFTVEYWNEEPTENTFAALSISENLSNIYEETFGDEILTQIGFGGEQVDTSWSIDEYKIESLYPGDVEFKARKISPLSIKDEQTSLTRFKRSLQIVLKTSDFRAFSSTQIINSIKPSSITSISSLGRSYPRKYPLRYRFFSNTLLPLESNLISVNNRGSVYVEPIIYLYGPGENILIENLTNGQGLEWSGKISEGDYLIFNCREETIVNSLGKDYIEFLSPTVEWLRLEPMWNDIFIQGNGFNEVTKMNILFKYGYM